MYLNTIVLWTVISCSIVAEVCSERLISPQRLFSDEPNILDGNLYASQKEDERLSRSLDEEDSHSRFRRAISPLPNSVPAPEISASKALCGHDRLFIRWTDTNEVVTNGAIIALCREVSSTRTTQKTKSSAIFVSYDFGRTWKNLTDEFSKRSGKKPVIDMYYTIAEKPNFVLFADKENKYIFYTKDGGKSINAVKVEFVPDGISINPGNPEMVIAYDSSSNLDAGKSKTRLHISKDGGQTYELLHSFVDVKAFYWGKVVDGDKSTDLFIEAKKTGGDIQGYKLDCSKKASSKTCGKSAQTLTASAPLNGDITDFLVKGPYMFVTQHNKGKTGLNLFVKYLRTGSFKKANIITTSPIKEVFVYDVSGGQVMLVVNHRKNETNLYNSLDVTGSNYSLSIPRVLYHNPNTEVSSHWLRSAVKYRFVDIRRVEGLPSVYFATQLTVGPVGGRYLISKMTFDKGGVWQKIKGPEKDKFNRVCRYPHCSLHVNLLYGSIYRYSKTTPLMSRKSAPGLLMATGVLGTNLKITPDTYLSRDGGNTFKQVLRGKRRFGFGDHGGFVLASDFTLSRYIQYSVDFENFYHTPLRSSGSVDIKMILTEPGEEGLVFLVIGTINGVYHVFQVNATRSLGRSCSKDDFYTVNVTDVGVGGCAVKQIELRNASTRCKTGKNYTRVVSISYDNCKCRRRHYICDLNFVPDKRGSCIQIPGTSLIPSHCPEGSYFMQSRGYSKIPKYSKCIEDNETRNALSHVKTPCPVEKLQLDVVKTIPEEKNTVVQIALDQKLHVNVRLRNGYLAHINFSYSIGDYNVSGFGKDYTTFNRVMDKPGKFVLQIVVFNPKSSITRNIHVNVLRKLNASMMTLRHLPVEPSIKEKVSVMLDITNDDAAREYGSLDYKWLVETYHPTKGKVLEKTTVLPALHIIFNATGHQVISLTVSNGVSSATVKDHVTITIDLQPKNVRLSYQEPRILKVEWDEVKEPGIKRYRVMYKKDTDLYYSEASCRPKSTETKCEIANVTYYTWYLVKLDAVLPDEYGPTSEIKSYTTPSGKPEVPRKVNLANKGNVSLEASWEPPSLPNGKLIGYMYKFYKANAKAPKHGTALKDPKLTSKVFENLEVDEDYLFEIAAQNEKHVGVYSEARSARTGVDKPTLPPTGIVITKLTTKTANLTWTVPRVKKGSKFFFSPKSYNIYMKQKGSFKKYDSTAENRYLFTKLNPDTKYEIAISAVAEGGEGPKATYSFKTLMGAPQTPVNLTTTEIHSRDATFSWSPAVPDDDIDSYALYQLSPVTVKNHWHFRTTKGKVEGLIPYTEYTFTVTASNELAESGRSENYTFKTEEDRPGEPFEVYMFDVWPASSSLIASWKPPTYPNGNITKYTVTWFPVSDIQNVEVEVVGKLSLRIDHLKEMTEYALKVQAWTSKGIGSPHSETFKTHYYQYGSQPVTIPFEKSHDVTKLFNSTFKKKFIEKVAKIAGIRKIRIADVRINKTANAVVFELISKEELHNSPSKLIMEEMNTVKAKLRSNFTVDGARTKANATTSGKPHPGTPAPIPAASGKKSGGSSSSMALIIGLVCAAVIIALLFVIVLIFVRYRRKGLYNKFDNQFQYNHDDDSVHYQPSPAVEIAPPAQKHRHKDIETVPLADADELT